MIRPGSLDVLPDCLDYEAPRPAVQAYRDYIGLAVWTLMILTIALPAAVSGVEAVSSAACPLWIIHGAEGRLLFAC